MIDIQKALKFPFTDPDWKRKLLPLALGGYVYIFAISIAIFVGVFISLAFIGSRNPMYLIPLAIIGFVAFIIVISTIYLQGYISELTMNIMHDQQPYLPENDNLKKKITLWFHTLILRLPTMLMSQALLTSFLVGVGLFASVMEKTHNPASFPIFLLILIIGYFLVFGTTALIQMFITNSMVFLYYQTGNLKDAYNFSKVFKIIKTNWQKLAVMTALIIAFTMIINLAMQFMSIIGLVIMPPVLIYMVVVISYITGETFKDLKNDPEIQSILVN